MNTILPRDRRPHLSDVIRAIGYGGIGLWAVLYICFPSSVIAGSLEVYTRFIWLGMGAFGGFMAMVGALTGRDVKGELPGILFACVGPFFYGLTNLYFVFVHVPGIAPQDQMTRLTIAVLCWAFTILLLPRAVELYSEGLRTRAMNRATRRGN